MPDNRRTREDDPLQYPQLVVYPKESYTPLDQIGTSRGGMALDGQEIPPMNEALLGSMSDRLDRIEQYGKEMNRLGNSIGSSQQEDQPGFFSRLGDGLSGIGSALGNGLNAITPSQGTIDNIAMRLQNAHAIGTGQLPMYMQMAAAQQQMGQANDLMAMKRAAVAQDLQKQQLAQQEKDEQQVLGIWQSNLPMSQKKKMSDFFAGKGVALAANLSRLGNEHLVGQLDTLGKYLPPGKMEELTNIMRQPNADLSQVEPWIAFAEEKHKAYGQAQMKAERFTGLLQAYNNGQIKLGSPEYDEFKQGVLERKKQQDESNKMDMDLEHLGLTNKKAQAELDTLQNKPSEAFTVKTGPNGQELAGVYDPRTKSVKTYSGSPMQPFERASDVEVAKALGKDFSGLQDAGRNAQAKISKLDRMQQLSEGLKTGKLTPTFADLAGIGESLGIHLDPKLGAKQAFEALSNEMALSARSTAEGGGMPGQMSNADRDYLKNTVPGLSQSPEGNKQLIDIHKKLAQRDVDTAKEARKYIQKNGKLDTGFYDHLQKYADTHPLFPKQSNSTGTTSIQSLPQGSKQVGTSKGKPVYEDANGRRWIGE